MKLTIILLDVDGVLIRRDKYFSNKFSEEYHIPIDQVLPFFQTEYKLAASGKEDIKDLLPRYLKKWGWKKTLEEFLDYWYKSEIDIDTKLLTQIKYLRTTGTKVYLVSDNEAGRAKYLMNNLKLKQEVDGGYFSCDLGVTKSNINFFRQIINSLQINPSQVYYWDDDRKNLEIAKEVGITTFLYEGFEKYLEQLRGVGVNI